MTPLLTLLDMPPYAHLPASWLGWAGWLFMLGITLGVVIHWRRYESSGRKRWLLVAILAFLAPLTNLFLGLRLPAGNALPMIGLPLSPGSPTLLFFSALAWMLAGGLSGPLTAAILGALAGLLRLFWDTHSLFTPLEFALLAVLFSVAVRQRYRTLTFRILRQPLASAACLIPLFALIYAADASFFVAGSLTARLDYALTHVGMATLATGGELLLGGLFAQVTFMAWPQAWGQKQPLQPSPTESSLEARFLFGGGILLTLLLLTLLIGDWLVAGNAARQMLRDRLVSTAQMTMENVPFFMETGQNLALELAAEPRLLTESGAAMSLILEQQIRFVPYFEALLVMDSGRNLLAVYPDGAYTVPSQEESAGVELAFQGVPIQIYTVPPAEGSSAARVSFIAAIMDETGQTRRVLIGHSDLFTNPLTRAIINSLQEMSDLEGEGILLDEQGRILYHQNPNQVMTEYTGERGSAAAFYDMVSPGGTRNLVYYQPAVGRPWAVVLIVPARLTQDLALDIAAPLSVMILILALITLVMLRLGLRAITASLQHLATEASHIARGKLDSPMQVDGVDEVGLLRHAFEQMRVSLKTRLEELNLLLLVSQGVDSSLEMQDAVRPVLEAVLATGASMARVALLPVASRLLEEDPLRFALGPAGDKYARLDEMILELTQKQERLVLPHLARARRGLALPPGEPQPAALLAVALRHENRFYGVLWAAYEKRRTFSEEDVRFLTTLAGHTSLAAANARLFQSAEVGRQRLAAILASTPDPVLVTDRQNHLLLSNPSAWRAFGSEISAVEGQPVERVFAQEKLLELLQLSALENQSAEVVLPDGHVYFATASAVMFKDRPVGRVCILRDVTHFKELDALKSDFVSAVSHDLRSPLTLMRGYATMLEMVGPLNELQQGHVRKIILGVESMARLVNNLLDLGRIEAGIGLQVEQVTIREIIEHVTSALQLQANQKNIAIDVEADAGLPPTFAVDRALLQQAVYNLVENALKYTSSGGRVWLRVRPREEGILFEVQDTGIGIAPADLPRLFEKFYRGSQREARQQRGSGLGLAIVRSIAERHGGKVWLESQLGKGSTFFLLIPLHPPAQAGKA